MIVHIVFFKAKETTTKKELQSLKEELESLPKEIKEITFYEVGLNFSSSPRALDMALYSKFHTKEDLKAYANHPAHLQVKEKIEKLCEFTQVVDYEI